MPKVRKLITDEEIAEQFRKLNPNNELVSVEKPKRGRPKGSKNKKKVVTKDVFKPYKYDPNKEYKFWFIADSCGCKIGSNINGSAMFCQHKNSMHLEERKK